jgi:hypothetical protein
MKNVNILLKFQLKNRLLMLMAFLCLKNGGKSPQKNPSITSLILILNFQKKWIRFMIISDIRIFLFA